MQRLVLTITFLLTFSSPAFALAQDATREWSDSTGKFKVQAALVEQKDGDVFLKTADGRTLKIPMSRLSKADQEFLKGNGGSPFMDVSGGSPSTAGTGAGADASSQGAAGNSGHPWNRPWQIDWDEVPLLDRGFDAQWSYQPSAEMALAFEAKSAVLPKKTDFFEGMRRLKINPLGARAVVGYTIGGGRKQALSRVSIIDLPSGKALNSDTVECNMCPLTVLNDGNTVLMQGTGNERDNAETPDQLQLWRVQGKKVSRSETWIPFPNDSESFGKQVNAKATAAIALADNRAIIVADNGHIACFDLVSRQAVWHVRTGRNFAFDFTTDRKFMFLLDEHSLLVVDPLAGKTVSSLMLEDKPHLGWPRIKLSPGGDKLLLTFINQLRVIDLASGETETKAELTWNGPIAPNGLSYPHADYALFDNHLLFHIPSQIVVCDYLDAGVITSIGGTEFVGLLSDRGGLVVPTSIPHPKAAETLEQAVDDPSVFLIHPGVEVSMNISGVGGAYRNEVQANLKEAVAKAGYHLVPNAPITLVASVSGPVQEAVSYIARGSYIANKYTSSVRLEWQGKSIWQRSGNNVPGFLTTSGDETIQQKLDELGKTPNLGFFKGVGLPKMMQTPKPGQPGRNNQNALMTSKFTLQGLIDSQ